MGSFSKEAILLWALGRETNLKTEYLHANPVNGVDLHPWTRHGAYSHKPVGTFWDNGVRRVHVDIQHKGFLPQYSPKCFFFHSVFALHSSHFVLPHSVERKLSVSMATHTTQYNKYSQMWFNEILPCFENTINFSHVIQRNAHLLCSMKIWMTDIHPKNAGLSESDAFQG